MREPDPNPAHRKIPSKGLPPVEPMRRIVSITLIIHHCRIRAGVFACRGAESTRLAGCNAVESELDPAAEGRVAVLCDRSAVARCKSVEQELEPAAEGRVAVLCDRSAVARCKSVEQEFDPTAAGRIAVLCDRSAVAGGKPVERELDPSVPDMGAV